MKRIVAAVPPGGPSLWRWILRPGPAAMYGAEPLLRTVGHEIVRWSPAMRRSGSLPGGGRTFSQAVACHVVPDVIASGR
jgi:hypothetical protein